MILPEKMWQQVDRYVRNVLTSHWIQTSWHWMFGVLWPLLVPVKPCQDMSMEIPVGLPKCKGFVAILVVQDRLLTMWHFILCHMSIDAPRLTGLCCRAVVRLHALPVTTESDKGLLFTYTTWGLLCSRLWIQWRLSMAYHLQTDGHTALMSTSMQQYLWVFVNHHQNHCVKWLFIAEFAANNLIKSRKLQSVPHFSLIRAMTQGTRSQMTLLRPKTDDH